jgi:hypothetical protein
MVKQALLVVILNWWDSPEEQAVFSMLVLAIYAAAAAWIRPDTDLLVNRTELAGVGISGFAVALGLSFTANNRKSSTSLKFGPDTRYLLYFVVAQLIFLAGAIRATAINVSAVRARKSVETRVKALHLAVVKTRRHGRLLNEASQRQMELSFSDSGDSSVRFRSADSSIKGRIRRQVGRHVRRMSPLKRSKSLSAAQAQQLAGHGREIEETEGRLEVLHTFRGPPLKAFLRARDSSDVRALLAFVALERRMGPTVADDSSVGNYSRQHEARFFHELAQAMPGLLDYVINTDRARRLALSAVICDVMAFDGHRRAAGARPVASLLIEPVDVPSVLHYSLTASVHDMNSLRVVIDGMIDASPRIRAQVGAVRARTRLAVRLQRAWRRRRGAVQVAPV